MLTIPHRSDALWDTSSVDLRERLGGYEVTALPAGQPALALVWSEPDPAGPGEDTTVTAAGASGPTFGALALLDDYRITRVPARAAS